MMKLSRYAPLRVFLLLLFLILLVSCGRRAPLRESRLLLGTSTTITIYDQRIPRGIMDRVFDRVAEIEARMSSNESNYDDTEVLRINRSAGREVVSVSADTFEVIENGLRFAELTDGVFDISVGPLVKVWGIGTPRERVPGNEEITVAQAIVDYRDVRLDPEERTVFLMREGMAIDVGGIAKGYAVEEAARMLRDAGVRHAVLDFGGDVYTVGSRPDGDPWRIGLQNPEIGRGSVIGIIQASDTSIVTSGAYERFFIEDGVQYHHMIDIKTGRPAENELTSVTVIADNATLSDVLSTAGFILGLRAGLRLVMDIPEAEAVFVTNDRRVFITEGVSDSFRVTDPEYRKMTLQSALGE